MLKKNLIALALASALVSPAAFAVDVTPATPDVFPTNAFDAATDTVTNGAAIKIEAAADDNYLGRSTGYNIRVTLSGGAVFAALVDAADITPLNGETVTVAGGGNIGDTSVTFSVVPATGVVENDGISINAGAFSIKNVTFMANGTPLKIDVRIGDPVGGQQLALTTGTTIATAEEAWSVTYTAPTNTDIKIDVGSDSGKKMFSSDGEVNTADTLRYNAGKVSVALNGNLTDDLGLDPAVATAPLTITGVNFSAFSAVNLQSAAACDGSGTTVAATINAAKTAASVAAATTVSAINGYHVCFVANGTTEIAAQDLSASLKIKQAGYLDSPTFVESAKFLDMAYNGANKYVWHFNPASNADQVSYLRLTNTSGTAGLVTISGICDDGSATPSVAKIDSFGAGKSLLLTSKDVEQGNALKGVSQGTGACVAGGKVRLTITGEFGSMEVQNFLRNATSAGSINTNVNNRD